METMAEDLECIQECVIKEFFYSVCFSEKFNCLGISIRRRFLEQIPDFQFNMMLPSFDARLLKRKKRDFILTLKVTPVFRVVMLVIENTGFFLDIDAECYIDRWVDRVPVYPVSAMLEMEPDAEPDLVLGPHFRFQGADSRGCLWLNSPGIQLMNLYAAFSLNVLMRKIRREFTRFLKKRALGRSSDMSLFLNTDDFLRNTRDTSGSAVWYLSKDTDDFRKKQSLWADEFKQREFQRLFAETRTLSFEELKKSSRKKDSPDILKILAQELRKAASAAERGGGKSAAGHFKRLSDVMKRDFEERDSRPALLVFSSPEDAARMNGIIAADPDLSRKYAAEDPASLIRIVGRRLGLLFHDEPDQFQDCYMRGFHAGADLMARCLPDICRDNPRVAAGFNPRFLRASYIQEILDGGFYADPSEYALSDRVIRGEDLPWSPGLFLEIIREYCTRKRELRLWDYRELLNMETAALRSPQLFRVRIPGADAGAVYAEKQLFLEQLAKKFEIQDSGIMINAHVFELSMRRKPAVSRVICIRPERMSTSELRFLTAVAGGPDRIHGISWQAEVPAS